VVNNIVGNIVSAPLLIPYESWRLQEKHKMLGNTYQYMSGRWMWWMTSAWAAIRANFGLAGTFKPGNRRRIALSLVSLYVFAFIFFPVMHRYLGWWGILKFYVIPYVVYHFMMSTFISFAYRIPFTNDKTLRVSIAFPKKLPRWMEWVTNDINYVVSLSAATVPELSSILSRLPNHSVKSAYEAIKGELSCIEQLGGEKVSSLSAFLKNVNWLPALYILLSPVVAVYGCMTTTFNWNTMILAIATYWVSGLGITVGYHRLFAHRAFECGPITRFLILMSGTMAFQGSGLWWATGHRIHHRYVDTDQDPYNSKRGFFWSHMGWLLVKLDKSKWAYADCTDLNADKMLQWQDKYFLPLSTFLSVVVPTVVAGLGWGDWRGGFYIAAVARAVFVTQCTFCINSVAHLWGDQPFTEEKSAVDNGWVSLLTLGEGYHNYHHEFPSDYRNGVKWYAYDPSKWLIWVLSTLGLTYDLKRFPENEIIKGELQMQEKKIKREMEKLNWGVPTEKLAPMTRQQVRERCDAGEGLVIVRGIVHDVKNFIPEHPGGAALIKSFVGKDASAAFHGGVYNHSNGARNLLGTFQVARVVEGETDKKSQ
jgi:stearoyl-CoA desaturase (delta-9 desaturase)